MIAEKHKLFFSFLSFLDVTDSTCNCKISADLTDVLIV